MERSKRQSENVYRFIKQFADAPRRSDTAAARPKTELSAPAPTPARRPDTQSLATPAPSTPSPLPDAAPVSTASTEPVATALAASPAPSSATPVATAASAPAVEEEDDELQLVEQVQPQFPRGLQGAAESGKVTVAFTVQPDGRVTDTSVVTASHRRFGKPARDAVAQWRFAPIKEARSVQVEIAFNQQ